MPNVFPDRPDHHYFERGWRPKEFPLVVPEWRLMVTLYHPDNGGWWYLTSRRREMGISFQVEAMVAHHIVEGTDGPAKFVAGVFDHQWANRGPNPNARLN